MRGGPKPIPVLVRIMRRVTINADGCWIYGGRLDAYGYGAIGVGSMKDGTRATRRAHRITYEHHKGPIPADLTLDHYRMNPGPRHAPCSHACVNPDHTEPVTRAENVMRGNGICASRARLTHCPKCGGAFSRLKNGYRECTPCHRALTAAWRAARRTA